MILVILKRGGLKTCKDLQFFFSIHHMNLIMNPAQAVNDEVLADAIEKWDQDCTNIRLVDPKCVLHDPFRLTAIKNLLSPKCLEQMDTLLNSSLMEDYTKVRAKV